MCYQTFVDSTRAVVPYLVEMAETGWRHNGIAGVFPAIRPVGVKPSRPCLRPPEGSTPTRGMIFFPGNHRRLHGLHAAAVPGGYPLSFDPHAVLELAGEAVCGWLEQDFDRMKARPPVTHGERLFAEYGYRGIRGEAQDGFPSCAFSPSRPWCAP